MSQEVLSESFVTKTFRKTRHLLNIINKSIAKMFMNVGDSNSVIATMWISVRLFRNKKFYEVKLTFEIRLCEKKCETEIK